MDRLITEFIRFTPDGKVEKVSWFKSADGTKYATKVPFPAGRMDLDAMYRSQYQEITI